MSFIHPVIGWNNLSHCLSPNQSPGLSASLTEVDQLPSLLGVRGASVRDWRQLKTRPGASSTNSSSESVVQEEPWQSTQHPSFSASPPGWKKANKSDLVLSYFCNLCCVGVAAATSILRDKLAAKQEKKFSTAPPQLSLHSSSPRSSPSSSSSGKGASHYISEPKTNLKLNPVHATSMPN